MVVEPYSRLWPGCLQFDKSDVIIVASIYNKIGAGLKNAWIIQKAAVYYGNHYVTNCKYYINDQVLKMCEYSW